MKWKEIKKALAAFAVGAMVLTAPVISSASTAYHPTTTSAVAVPVISLVKEKGENYLTWNTKLGEDDRLYIEISTDPSFPDDSKTRYTIVYGDDGITKRELDGYLKPGKNYIRAFVKKYNKGYSYSAYSKTLECVGEIETTNVTTEVKSTSITLRLSNSSDVTGYEIYRAKGTSNSYMKVTKTSDMIVKDSGLEAGQTYTYKVRGYVYANGATITGDWTYVQVTTWGNALNVKATPTVTKKSANVKLTWAKVSGATSYEIYRASGTSGSVYATNYAPYKSISYTNWELIATKSKKTKSFTDKKVKAGVGYTYKVVAVKQEKAKKKTTKKIIEGSTSVSLKFNKYFSFNNQVENKNGSVTVTWNKVVGATGFLIEKRDNKTGKYGAYTTLKGTATSYTFPATANDDDDVYHVYAYSGNVYSNYASVTVDTVKGMVPAVDGVKASATADGQGVNISWSPVAGAAYYRVYRSRTLSYYNAQTGNYGRSGDYVYVKDTDGYSNSQIKGTSVVDVYTTRTDSSGKVISIINEGPKQGVVYYYYVAAYKSNGEYMESSRYSTKPARMMLTKTTIAAPKSVTAKAAGKGKVTVSWKKVSGASEYCIYRSKKKSSGYELISRVSSKKTKTTLKNQTAGKYYYIVKAVKTNEAGAEQLSKAKVSKKITVK